MKRLEEAGVIERTDASEWISHIVVAQKKSGQVRICVDLRKLNEAVIEDRFPLPTVDEILSEKPGATHFSKLDLKSAYPQLELEPESRDLTAFVTHEGVFSFSHSLFRVIVRAFVFPKQLCRGLF